MNLIVVKLIAAHLIAWGRTQRRDWLPGGESSLGRALAGVGVYAAVALLLIAMGHRPTDWGTILWLVGTTSAVRLVLDVVCGRYLRHSWSNLIALQAADVMLICALTAMAFDSRAFASAVTAALNSPETYGVVAAYAASLWLGGALVRLVTSLLPERTKEERIGMEGAGSIIGILERLLVTSFVLFWPAYGAAAIGLIFSAKSIARFPEMGKKDGTHFAEYYLVGTLTSLAVAIGSGMIARTYLL